MKINYTHRTLKLILLFTLAFFIQSCSEDNIVVQTPIAVSPQTNTFSNEVATSWFDLELDLIKQEPSLGFTPPVSSRALGYTGITLYESVVNGMPQYRSLAGQLNGLNSLPEINSSQVYNWPSCANSALHYIIKKIYSNATGANIVTIDSLYNAFKIDFQSQVPSDVYDRSDEFGIEIADAIYNWSLSDGGNEGQYHNTDPSYVPPAGAGLWVPTPPDYGAPVQPYWGSNRPFLEINITENQPPVPVEYSESDTSLFYAEAFEVYSTSLNLTQDQKDIAAFWADDNGTYTPPGHWFAINEIILNSLGSKLDVAATSYAKLGIAESDAFISCWKTKFAYNVLRPITYIRNLIDPSWSSYVTTPSFPEYTSGHSSQSGAAAQVLSDIFGYNFSFTDNSKPDPPYAPRSFNSFFQAADEAAISRLYGGIHYRAANERGLECGKFIGRNVSALHFLR